MSKYFVLTLECFIVIVGAALLDYGYNRTMFDILRPSIPVAGQTALTTYIIHLAPVMRYGYLVWLALFEEMVFRYIPLVSAMCLSKKWLLIPVVIMSSILFGLVHGGIANLAFQGVSGIIYCLVFLEYGGKQGKPIKGLIMAILTHATYNMIVFSL